VIYSMSRVGSRLSRSPEWYLPQDVKRCYSAELGIEEPLAGVRFSSVPLNPIQSIPDVFTALLITSPNFLR
jgi:hypothetical protein